MNELRITFGLDHFDGMVDEKAAQEILDIAARSILPRLHGNQIIEEIDRMISFGASLEKISGYLTESQRTKEVMKQLEDRGSLHERA